MSLDERQAREQAWAGVSPISAPDPLLYLDTMSAMDFVKAYKRQSFQMLDLKPGHHILDIGCGPGDDAQALAQLVGTTGRVVGVDNDEEMIAEARKRAAGKALPVIFCRCDAHRLAFDDITFDCCRADRVFQHLEDPQEALREAARVTRPGGRVVIMEPDWEMLGIDHTDRATTRKIVNFVCDRIVRNGWMGRQLPNLFQACGLAEIRIAASSLPLTDFTLADRLWGLRRNARRAERAGVISGAEATQWIADLEQAAQNQRFFGAVTGFAVFGRKV